MRQSSKNLLSSSIINKIDNLALRAKLVVEGFLAGLHKSPYHGFSVEFAEHRPYEYGDDVKYIDWKLWAKTDRLFIKQFEEETNLKCYILLDRSKSMKYASNKLSKFEYSKSLAASLAYLMIKQQDAVGLSTFDNKINLTIPPKTKPSHFNLIAQTLHNAKTGNTTKVSNILHILAQSIKKRGLIILISDLVDSHEDIMNGLKHFRYKGHEVIIFHILDPREIDLNFNESVKFIDLESDESITTDPRQVKAAYQKEIKDLVASYKNQCRKNKIDFINISTSDSLENSLINYLIKRNKLV
tara:strand:- start:761 stop:1657 length:897 start_codon:yes stop_codon:yes gene_type:complete